MSNVNETKAPGSPTGEWTPEKIRRLRGQTPNALAGYRDWPTLWETALLEGMRRIQLKPSFKEWKEALIAQPGFALAPLDDDVVDAALATQVRFDVFDAAIVATARAKRLPLITKDELITKSKAIEVLW